MDDTLGMHERKARRSLLCNLHAALQWQPFLPAAHNCEQGSDWQAQQLGSQHVQLHMLKGARTCSLMCAKMPACGSQCAQRCQHACQ